MPTPKPRYRLVQDDDGHWYLIRADQQAAFTDWQAAGYADGWEAWDGPLFSEMRIDGPSSVTFTDPIEDD